MLTIQVNHSPSFSTDTPLDLAVKKKLILETVGLVRVDAKQLRRGKAADKQLASERLLRTKGRATADQTPAISLEEMQYIRSTAACIPAYLLINLPCTQTLVWFTTDITITGSVSMYSGMPAAILSSASLSAKCK